MPDSAAPVSVDGIDDRPGAHPVKSLVIGGPGTYVPFPSHSFLTPIGPTAWLLMLDCRYVDFTTEDCMAS
jgi:hypothetical protein